MQVFISWSGHVSRGVAETLASFIQHVVRGVNTFISTHDIDAGDRWEERVCKELAITNHVILCVTRDNQSSPWLNYEAGALGKLLGSAKVIPYTLGFPSGEMQVGPLSRFQGVENNEAGTWNLVRTLNRAMPTPNEDSFVKEDFELWWPRLEQKMDEMLTEAPNPIEQLVPTERDMLFEIRQDIKRLVDLSINRCTTDTDSAPELVAFTLRDPLTQLANRRAFMERATALEAANIPYVIGFLDLDNFKIVNDSLGHAKGDEFLEVIALALKEQLPNVELVARIGGDEFAAIFCMTTPLVVAKLLTEFISSMPRYASDAGFPTITASGGVSNDCIESAELKLRDADTAMYQAKNEGRGRIKIAE